MKIRRVVATAISLAVALSLAACGLTGFDTSHPITDYLDPDTVEFLNNWDIYTPTSLTYTIIGKDDPQTYGIADLTYMKDIRDALLKVRVGDEADEQVEGAGEIFTFRLPSGSSFLVEFAGGNLVAGDRHYAITDDGGLWELADAFMDDWYENEPAEGEGTDAVGDEAVEASDTAADADGTSGTAGGSGGAGGATESAPQADTGGAAGGDASASAVAATDGDAGGDAGQEVTTWMEPIGETTDGQNVEVLVNAQ